MVRDLLLLAHIGIIPEFFPGDIGRLIVNTSFASAVAVHADEPFSGWKCMDPQCQHVSHAIIFPE